MRHAAAICCWLFAWLLAGLIPAALFAARSGNRAAAGIELAAGIAGAARLACAGAALW